jgi:hypothetical protein
MLLTNSESFNSLCRKLFLQSDNLKQMSRTAMAEPFIKINSCLISTLMDFFLNFHQHGATSHISRTMQALLDQSMEEFIKNYEWSPQRPVLNPMDYSIWNLLSEKGHTEVFIGRNIS